MMQNEQSQQKTVLIVDDSPVSLRHASGILKAEYRVACAKSGEMALAYLRTQNHPDLILLDVNMPEMDGFAVLRRITAIEGLQNTPVLFLTGVEDAAQEEGLSEISEERILHKPVQPRTLLEKVRAFV